MKTAIPHKNVLLLGLAAAGKSTFGNFLLESFGKQADEFKTGDGTCSHTKETSTRSFCLKVRDIIPDGVASEDEIKKFGVKTVDDEVCLNVIDTPGIGGNEKAFADFCETMTQKKIVIDLIILVVNYENQCDGLRHKFLKNYKDMFLGNSFLSNVMVALTHVRRGESWWEKRIKREKGMPFDEHLKVFPAWLKENLGMEEETLDLYCMDCLFGGEEGDSVSELKKMLWNSRNKIPVNFRGKEEASC